MATLCRMPLCFHFFYHYMATIVDSASRYCMCEELRTKCTHLCPWFNLLAWWRHQMEPISALLALCAGNSPVTGEFPAQRPVTRSFDVFFNCAWIYDWVNDHKAGDLRRHRGHYDVNAMHGIHLQDLYPTLRHYIGLKEMKSGCCIGSQIKQEWFVHI